MKWSPRRRLVAIILAVVLAQGAVIALLLRVEHVRNYSHSDTFRYELLTAAQAPDITLQRPDGSTRRLMDNGATCTLLHFWATWCPPCREEIPRMLALGRDLRRGAEFEIIAVSLDKDWEAVAEFFEGKIPSEVFRDEVGTSASAYGVSELQETYLIDRDGALRVRFAEAIDWRDGSARKFVEGRLNAP